MNHGAPKKRHSSPLFSWDAGKDVWPYVGIAKYSCIINQTFCKQRKDKIVKDGGAIYYIFWITVFSMGGKEPLKVTSEYAFY